MKKVLAVLSISVVAIAGNTQGIINNGAYIVMTGASQIYVAGGTNGDYLSQANGWITPSGPGMITLEGDWTNNAGNTGFTADAGGVTLGGAAESINGTSSTTFYNLILSGSSVKTLNVNTNVGGAVATTGGLYLTTIPLILNSYTLTITDPVPGCVFYTTGCVVSETNAALNPSIMRWNTGTFSGAYVFPFGTAAGVQLPLTVNKAAATASVLSIATRPTAASDNLPWASGVTQMYDPTLAQDGSDEAVIDRWWEITASVAITADVTFSYRGAENTLSVPYNTGNLGAQYWATAWIPDNSNIGSAAAVTVGVGSVTAPGLALSTSYTPWVLSSLSAPLPVELTSFTTECVNNNALIEWTTASETNNHFFTIERSDDGINYNTIATVNGNGTTSQTHNYSYTDNVPVTATAYYRISQTDYNGSSQQLSTRTLAPCTSGEFISAWADDNGFVVDMDVEAEGDYLITIIDSRGRLVSSGVYTTSEGFNRFELSDAGLANGAYLVRVQGTTADYSKKVMMVK